MHMLALLLTATSFFGLHSTNPATLRSTEIVQLGLKTVECIAAECEVEALLLPNEKLVVDKAPEAAAILEDEDVRVEAVGLADADVETDDVVTDEVVAVKSEATQEREVFERVEVETFEIETTVVETEKVAEAGAAINTEVVGNMPSPLSVTIDVDGFSRLHAGWDNMNEHTRQTILMLLEVDEKSRG